MRFIWATRGRSWGFRFLRDGGLADPRSEYLRGFAGIEQEPEVWRRTQGFVSVRFPDPLNRQDSAGRVIPHEFVVFEPTASQIQTVQDARDRLWPLVSVEFARVWDQPDSPDYSS